MWPEFSSRFFPIPGVDQAEPVTDDDALSTVLCGRYRPQRAAVHSGEALEDKEKGASTTHAAVHLDAAGDVPRGRVLEARAVARDVAQAVVHRHVVVAKVLVRGSSHSVPLTHRSIQLRSRALGSVKSQ